MSGPKGEKERAFAFALDLVELFIMFEDDEDEIDYLSAPIHEYVVEALDVGDHPTFRKYADWTYTLNVTYLPMCCGGECNAGIPSEFGYIDIHTTDNDGVHECDLDAKGVYRFSLSEIVPIVVDRYNSSH